MQEAQLDPFFLPYNQILTYLLKGGMVTLKELTLTAPPYPPGYDANAHYEYYRGFHGAHNGELWGFKT